jgi:hypothetical protein
LTDTQILTIAISIIFPVLVLLYSNSRVGEVSNRIGDTNKRIDDSNKRMDELKADLIKHIDNGFEHMTLLLKLHEAEHHKK